MAAMEFLKCIGFQIVDFWTYLMKFITESLLIHYNRYVRFKHLNKYNKWIYYYIS